MVKSELELLATIRTLLALERNYLAEERTCLAEFRTGLTLTVIGPTTSTIFAFIFSRLELGDILLYDIITFTFFSILTVIGVWMVIRSRSKLTKLRIMPRF